MVAEPFTVEKAGMGVGSEEGQKGGCVEIVRFEEEKDDMWECPFCGVYLSKIVFAEWLRTLHLPSCGMSGELTVSVEFLLDSGAEEM